MAVRSTHDNALYRTLWRWHFYAGLFVIPFILILSVTGAIYLFKPQIEAWEEASWRSLPTENAVAPSQQVGAALGAFPGARLHSYRLPVADSDAALVHLELADGKTMRDVFVAPQGQVVGSLNPDWRIADAVSKIHGNLLVGKVGGWLVELAASWAIVMILTGLYLWWPKGESGGWRVAGVVWPRFKSKAFLRDLHAVTGFWVAGLALVLLVSGLPWAGVWGDAFKAVRAQAGWVQGKQDWTTGGAAHAEHDHAAMLAAQANGASSVSINAIVAKAKAERLAFPVIVTPPGEHWTVKSDAQNRPLRATITYDAMTGERLTVERFADRHPIDRAVGYGIAWHEGQLFGWINQLVGVFTALALVTLTVSGFLLWRKRKPEAGLGAPAAPARRAKMRGVAVIMLVLPLL
ncbi:MAG: PepSY domain-containing protein, partial [Sphingopyxis sp.]|nr:PepSY domain-containing protein [Sphingopyxis sp.]